MSAEKLTVIFTPAISRRDYLAKLAEKANAQGLTKQSTCLVNCNHACRAQCHFRSRKLRVVLGGILLLSDSRAAEFERHRGA
jgi:hypothetical protein